MKAFGQRSAGSAWRSPPSRSGRPSLNTSSGPSTRNASPSCIAPIICWLTRTVSARLAPGQLRERGSRGSLEAKGADNA